jgi:hypothetical protein
MLHDNTLPYVPNTIFIQIASYRDPELVNTINDCIAQAHAPENLRFCIAWQHSPDENIELLQYKDDPRFIILDIPHEKAHGACWARNLVQQYYNDETFTLQIDSHMRFAKDWDIISINMLRWIQVHHNSPKPLLTAYTASFNPENDPAERKQENWKMTFDRFTPEGVVFFLPASFWPEEEKEPLRGRFYSAHCAFTLGQFCREVQHDPEYYFHGEEISIGVRAFTHGYDIYHPNQIICWHEYTRKGRTKSWDDGQAWVAWNNHSLLRNRKLFEMDGEVKDVDFGKYGFGTERTLEDFERYAGMQFKTRGVQQYTLDHKAPPNPQFTTDEEYQQSFMRRYRHCIDIYLDSVPLRDYTFWCVAFKDKNGNDMYRQDADANEINGFFQKAEAEGTKWINLWREWNRSDDNLPASWIVWPHSASQGWCPVLEGALAHGK